MNTLLQDVAYSWRMMRKSPAFTVVAIVTLALSIGANTAIISLADALFRRTIPGTDASRLVGIYAGRQGRITDPQIFSHGDYLELRASSRTIAPIAAHYSTSPLTLARGDASREVSGAVVSAEFFSLLGVKPRVGRFFSEMETRPRVPAPVAVLSFGAWQDWFAGDPGIAGRTLTLNGTVFTIIGVAPRGFYGASIESRNDVWIPMSMLGVGYRWCKDPFGRNCEPLALIGRLAPGRTVREARSELDVLRPRLVQDREPDERTLVLDVRELRGVDQGPGRVEQLRIVTLLLTAAALLLLVACANLAGTLLSRGVARRREIAIRRALGASPSRIVRQLATEGVVLAVLGAVAGLLVALWIQQPLEALYSLDPEGYRRYYELRLGPVVVGWAGLLSIVAGLAFGGGPAFQAVRVDLTPALKGDPTRVVRSTLRARDVLLATQVALACLGLVSAGLLVRSMRTIRSGSAIDVDHIALLRVRPSLVGYDTAKARPLLRDVVRRLEAAPGVRSVTLGGTGTVWDDGYSATAVLPGAPPPADGTQPEVRWQAIGTRFFETLGVPLVGGRDFTDRDGVGAPLVAIVNQTLERAVWPNKSALGQSLMVNGRHVQIVGVAADVGLLKAGELRSPMVYTAFWQDTSATEMRLAVRVVGDPAAALPMLERTARTVDATVPVTEVLPLRQQMDAMFSSVLLARSAISYASMLAVVLCALGLYGALAFAVTIRTREIAVRVALGARHADVVRVVYREAFPVVAVGIVSGLAASWASTRLLASFIYGAGTYSVLPFAGAVALLVGISIVAAAIPIRRAVRIEPRTAMQV